MTKQIPLKICLFGPQGSGKGTQAQKISEYYGIPAIAPGNMFRKAIADETLLGMRIKEIFESGQLVPNEITNTLVNDRIHEEDCINGFILDGYPRNTIQADALDGMTSLTHVIVLEVQDEESVNRISRRRSCEEGHSYHLDFKPSKEEGVCDIDGKELVQRKDDTAEAIKQRLGIYHEETAPLLERYESRGVLHRIDGMQSIDQVWEDIRALL